MTDQERKPDFLYAESMALETLQKHNIQDPPVPVEKMARDMGLKVQVADFTVPEIAGLLDLKNKFIVISRSDSSNRQAFTIAHELGHFVLHRSELEADPSVAVVYRKPIGGEVDPIEQEANCFAANLLVPGQMLLKIHSYDLTPIQLAGLFAVSLEVMTYRLKQTGLR